MSSNTSKIASSAVQASTSMDSALAKLAQSPYQAVPSASTRQSARHVSKGTISTRRPILAHLATVKWKGVRPASLQLSALNAFQVIMFLLIPVLHAKTT